MYSYHIVIFVHRVTPVSTTRKQDEWVSMGRCTYHFFLFHSILPLYEVRGTQVSRPAERKIQKRGMVWILDTYSSSCHLLFALFCPFAIDASTPSIAPPPFAIITLVFSASPLFSFLSLVSFYADPLPFMSFLHVPNVILITFVFLMLSNIRSQAPPLRSSSAHHAACISMGFSFVRDAPTSVAPFAERQRKKKKTTHAH